MAGFDKADRLRHGRHLDRCLPLRGNLRAQLRDRGRRRAHARADDAYPHGRGGGGSILPSRTAASRSAPKAPAPIPAPPATARRAADRHRLQRHAGQAAPAHFPAVFGPERRPAARRRRRAREVRGAGPNPRRDRRRPQPEEVAEGFLKIAVENMANAIKKISSSAAMTSPTTRCELRRRGRAARLPRRRCAGHEDGDPASLRRAFCRPTAWGSPISARCAGRPSGAEDRGDGAHCCATRARTRRWRFPSALAGAMRAAFETAHRARFGFTYAGKPMIVVERRAGGRKLSAAAGLIAAGGAGARAGKARCRPDGHRLRLAGDAGARPRSMTAPP
jgi:hypothetical protein